MISFFKEYREIEFKNALNYATKNALELNIDPVFPQRCIIQRKREFDENLNTPQTKRSEDESFRVNYFFILLIKILYLLIRDLSNTNNMKVFLVSYLLLKNLQSLDNATLESCCSHFEETLKHNEQWDTYGK